MKVVFLMAQTGTLPGGGAKVIYEYANGLCRRGHEVHLVHAASVPPKNSRRSLRSFLKPYHYARAAILGDWKPHKWFHLLPQVKLHWVPTLRQSFIPSADVYVATWWATAQYLAEMRSLPGRRLYLIQHLETWAFLPEAVMATWKAPLEKIVIAKWLKDIADDLGESCDYIPNGLDFKRFGCDVPPENRQRARVAMPFHDAVEWKGSSEGLEAVLKLKLRHPEMEVEIFGLHDRPGHFPAWIVYHQCATQDELRRIYNRAAIFIAPSHSEGWGLPPCEAMMCGAAVVATDIGGHREFCGEENCLLVPPKNPSGIVEAVSRLIVDDRLRIQLAKNGNRSIQRFQWEPAVEAFEKVLLRTPSPLDSPEIEYQIQIQAGGSLADCRRQET